MNFQDYSQAIMFAICVILLSAFCYGIYRKQEAKNNLTETERNRRIMESVTEHCNEYN